MPSIQKVILESIIVGLMLIPFTYVASYIAKYISKKPSLPDICSKWNQYYVMEITLFLSGFIFHFMSEIVGLNKWYVRQYS